MASQVVFSYKDYSKEISHARFDVTTMTAANFDATNTAINALSTAILGIQAENCLQGKRVVSASTFVTRAPATDKAAQREKKWLLTVEDNTLHTLSRHEVPIADTQYVTANSDFMDLSADPGLALKTAVEAVVKSPAGNAVTLISVQFVGKRI